MILFVVYSLDGNTLQEGRLWFQICQSIKIAFGIGMTPSLIVRYKYDRLERGMDKGIVNPRQKGIVGNGASAILGIIFLGLENGKIIGNAR